MIANVIRSCFPVAAQAVADKSEDINKLNVFPVPDGDTGTNMSLTLGTVVREVAALPADSDMAAVAKAITHGSLMGARGNSGVITSQILRGMAEGLVGAHDPVTADDIAVAFRNSVKVAFKAVRKPVEGTILTVIRDISSRADRCAKEKMGVPEAIIAQAWLLHNPMVSSILSGPRTLDMLHDTIKALDVTFTEEQIKELETIFPSHGMNKQGTLVTEHVEATDAYNW